ncbi:MAG: CARDB domain-containing protein [bacterium]|nr:CARDB domain-containing protein [bacterium]
MFSVVVIIDQVQVQQEFISGLDAYQTYQFNDLVQTLDPGLHTIGVFIDPSGTIPETNENDNYFEKTFYVEEPTISFSGYLAYQDPTTLPDTTSQPMSNMIVRLMDYDVGYLEDDILDEYIVEDDGWFELGPVSNSEPLQGRQDVYIKILANNDFAFATSIYNGNDTSSWQSIPGSELLSGEYDTVIVLDVNGSGDFHIVDALCNAYERWYEFTSLTPPKVHVSAGDGYGTQYTLVNGSPIILIDEQNYPDGGYPDQFDKSVIYHEFAHYLSWYYDFMWNPTGVGYDYFSITSPDEAALEGWAEFASALIFGDSLYKNYYLDNSGQFTIWDYHNLESGIIGWNSLSGLWAVYGDMNNRGAVSLVSVAGMMWDIYDSHVDDYSTFGLFPAPTVQASDGVGDWLSDGPDNVLSLLLNRYVGGEHPDNIEEFWEAWFQSPSMGNYYAMRDIWYEHGIDKGCCVGTTGNVDNDPSDYVDISDLTYLVDYLFGGGPSPVCLEEANVNGSSNLEPDISDLTYLNDFMFGGGPPPPTCP